MNLLFFTAMTTAAVAALPGLSRHTPIVIDSTETCQFHLGSKPYDLCPILGGAAVKLPLLVKGGKTEYRFYFGLDGGILADDLVGVRRASFILIKDCSVSLWNSNMRNL
jgi:hypothetical protein